MLKESPPTASDLKRSHLDCREDGGGGMDEEERNMEYNRMEVALLIVG